MVTKDTQLVQLPLKDIFVDYDWNSRSKRDVMSNQSDGAIDDNQKEGNGLGGLCASIQTAGQDDPVVVRLVDNKESLGGKRVAQGMPPSVYQGEPCELVCGFRRYTAITILNEKKVEIPRLQSGHIWAMLRELTPTESRLLNIRENTDRQSLPPPDLVWGIIQLQAKGLGIKQISEQLNVSISYISRLSKVASLPLIIIEHWRGSKVKLPGIPTALNGDPIPTISLTATKLLGIAETISTDNDKIEMYVNMTLGRKTEMSAPSVDMSEQHVIEVARTAGQLVLTGVLNPGHLQWSSVIGPKRFGFLVSSGNAGPNPAARLQKLWKLAQETYDETLLKGKQS